MEFTDDSHLHLVLENTIIAQTRSHEIVEFLEKIVCERCGMDLIVDLDFEEPKESKYKKNSDLQIQFEIRSILKNINLKDEDGETVAVASDANEKKCRLRSDYNIWRQWFYRWWKRRKTCKKRCKICKWCRK